MNLLNNKKAGKMDHLINCRPYHWSQNLNGTWSWSVEKCASCRKQLGRGTRNTKSWKSDALIGPDDVFILTFSLARFNLTKLNGKPCLDLQMKITMDGPLSPKPISRQSAFTCSQYQFGKQCRPYRSCWWHGSKWSVDKQVFWVVTSFAHGFYRSSGHRSLLVLVEQPSWTI